MFFDGSLSSAEDELVETADPDRNVVPHVVVGSVACSSAPNHHIF